MIDSYYATFPDQLNSGELCCCYLGLSNSSAHSDQEGNIHKGGEVGVRKTTGRGGDDGGS